MRGGLQVDPALDPSTANALQAAADEVDLPRDRVELLGQAPGLARSFVDAVEDDYHEAFLDVIAWEMLRDRRDRLRASVRRAAERVLASSARDLR